MSHRVSLDVSTPVLKSVTGWIARHRRRPGARPAQRAGTVPVPVALVLRWLRHRLDVRTPAGEVGLGIATGHRHLHEALDVIAAHAPDLDLVLGDAHAAGLPFLCLDAPWCPDRVAARAERGPHLWYCGKHHACGGSVRVLTDPTGFPLWISAVRSGSAHGLTAARDLVPPTPYPHPAGGLPGLAEQGYTGAGVGVHVPVRDQPDGPLHLDNRCLNRRITALRAATQRGHALLGRGRARDRVTFCPQRISAIAAAALVLTSLDRGIR